MQALQHENARLMAQLASLQAERQPTEEYAEAMNEAIADAAEAEAQRDAAQARVAELTKPPVCDNAGHPIAEMIYREVLDSQCCPGIVHNDHPEIRIRLEMNAARTDLNHSSFAYYDVHNKDRRSEVRVNANEGAQALRLAIEGGLNEEKVKPMNERAWRTPKELLAGPQTYIFHYIDDWHDDDDFIGFQVRWGANANGEGYEQDMY
jgi:hypothetical protein